MSETPGSIRRQDAGGRARHRRVDRLDARVGVHRPRDDGIGLPGKVHVADESTLSPEQPTVLKARHRLSDPELSHQPSPRGSACLRNSRTRSISSSLG